MPAAPILPTQTMRTGDLRRVTRAVVSRESINVQTTLVKTYGVPTTVRTIIFDKVTNNPIAECLLNEYDTKKDLLVVGLPDTIVIYVEVQRGKADVLLREVETDFFYDDARVAPQLGVDTVPEAIDALKTGSGGTAETREVVLGPFADQLAPGTVLNIQTGVYVGPNSPVARAGDLNVTLPASGVAFRGDGRIETHLNGQELIKGDGTGNGVVEWVSATQVKFSTKVKVHDTLIIRAPFPTA